jgi:cytochrome c biogenesis protein CcmG, thiol:disulfide interchange protein DsbE
MAIGAVVLLVALLAYGLLSKGANRRIDEALAEGRSSPAPSFELPVLEPGRLAMSLARQVEGPLADGSLSLGELRGTPLVLNFWASWCIPCREEAPLLESGWRHFGRRGVLFIGLNMQDLTSDARGFLSEFEIRYPTIRDQGNGVAQSYGVTGVPETYFIDARGRVVAHVIGVVSEEQLRDGAEAARTGRVVGSSEGGARRPQR